ncbi:dipeptide-binding protein DppE [Thalassobacillus devorans]|uniref:Dipeptide-binding protein DppE n=1 Tax=Thalassobacillus devorans TaxID=279813 RepID=A0ABQ1P3Z8_9BACI|nr:peptide ABC transporter substrate-binding protein [Thalassobacillus devorans]NIK27871.1 dipeptide transport system substrate-binding protein [Thalassobacillus devorans]GGC90701.1 dipeptide-binding protein DppE [Thalassobacillus devorans]
MRKWLMLLLAVMVAIVLAACTTSGSSDSGEQNDGGEEASGGEKVLKLNNGSEPTSLDPPIGFDSYSWNVLNNLMEGMTRLDESHEPAAATAEKWDVSEDGTVYTFHIREDANWSNGDPVTAGDFEFAWKRLVDPEVASPAAFLGYFIEGAEAFNNGEGSEDDVMVEAVDEKTLEVTLTAPTGYFLHVTSNPAFFPINEEVQSENEEWFAEADSFVGNGPFQLAEWTHDSELVMEKNDEYWDADTVKLDKVEWAMVNDTNTEYQMYESGDLDTSDIPSEMSEELIDSENVVIEEQAGTHFYRFNVNEEPFTNEKIRKAFAMAVNQEEIVEYVTKNKEEPAYGFVSYGFADPSGEDFRDKNGDLVEYDPEQAKQLLEEGMEEEGYEELPKVTLTYNTSDVNKSIAETVQSMYKENLDVDITLENTEWNVFLQDQKDLKHQLSRSSFLADYADPINFLESFTTDSSMNRTGWSNEEYDKLIQQAKSEADEEQRFEYMYEAEKILFEEMPLFPIHFYNQVVLQKDEVENIVRHPVGYLELKWADKN